MVQPREGRSRTRTPAPGIPSAASNLASVEAGLTRNPWPSAERLSLRRTEIVEALGVVFSLLRRSAASLRS
jgi:hypothetical protein